MEIVEYFFLDFSHKMEQKTSIESYLEEIEGKLRSKFKKNEHFSEIFRICEDIKPLEKKLVSNHYKIQQFLRAAGRTNETSNETIDHKISEIIENQINFKKLKNNVISLINEVESKLPDVNQNLENMISEKNNELREVNFSIDQLENEITKIREAKKNHQKKLELLAEKIEKINDEDCEPLKIQTEPNLKKNASSSQNEFKKDSSSEFTFSKSVFKLVVFVDDEKELKKLREIEKSLKCDLKPDFCTIEKKTSFNCKILQVKETLKDVNLNLENMISEESNEFWEVNFSIDQLKNESTKIRKTEQNHQNKLEYLDETIEKVNDEDREPLKIQTEPNLKKNASSSQNEIKKDSSNEFTVSKSVPKLVVLSDDEKELKKLTEIVKSLKYDLKPDFCKLEKNKIINRKILQLQETLLNVINAKKKYLDFYFIILISKEYTSVNLDLSVISNFFPKTKITLKLFIFSSKSLNQFVLRNNDLIKSERTTVNKNNFEIKLKSEFSNFFEQFYDNDHYDLEIAQKNLSNIEEKLAVHKKEKDELSEQRANAQNKILGQNDFTKEINEILNDLKKQYSKFNEEIKILIDKESNVENKIKDQVIIKEEIEKSIQILLKNIHDQFKRINTPVVTENQSLISYLNDFLVHLENLDAIQKEIHKCLNKIKEAYNGNSFSLVKDHIERIENLITNKTNVDFLKTY